MHTRLSERGWDEKKIAAALERFLGDERLDAVIAFRRAEAGLFDLTAEKLTLLRDRWGRWSLTKGGAAARFDNRDDTAKYVRILQRIANAEKRVDERRRALQS
jgi:hypothetical protein